MIFIYMRDGSRLDLPEAVSVVHRSDILFLDKDGEVVRQMEPGECYAYGHVLYDDEGVAYIDQGPSAQRSIEALDPPQPLVTPRRHRRGLSAAAQGHPEHAEQRQTA
jgi:hypothetical protein